MYEHAAALYGCVWHTSVAVVHRGTHVTPDWTQVQNTLRICTEFVAGTLKHTMEQAHTHTHSAVQKAWRAIRVDRCTPGEAAVVVHTSPLQAEESRCQYSTRVLLLLAGKLPYENRAETAHIFIALCLLNQQA